MTDIKRLGEFGLINRLQSRLKSRSSRLKVGIGDDCAVYASGPGDYQLMTTDALVETVHFDLTTTSPELLGRKALAVNVSDIAAMGGTPEVALITMGVPAKFPVKTLDKIYSGLNKACHRYEVVICGGDTVSSPEKLFINVTLIGRVKRKHLFLRSGAQAGHLILLSGYIGDSSLGLKLLQSDKKKYRVSEKDRKILCNRHLLPEARVEISTLLTKANVRAGAMIDVSDGLIQDLRHLCKASNTGAIVSETALPLSPSLRRVCEHNQLNYLDYALSGGEDYELLFTLRPEDVKKISRQLRQTKTPVTVIGEMTRQSGELILKNPDGERLSLDKVSGYNHFQSMI